MTMHIDLNNPALEAMVQQKVSAGLYSSASAVIGEALARMAQADARQAEKLQRLRADIQEGLASGPAGILDIEAVIERGRQRLDNGK